MLPTTQGAPHDESNIVCLQTRPPHLNGYLKHSLLELLVEGPAQLTTTYTENRVRCRNQSPDQITQELFRKDRITPGTYRSLETHP